MSTASDVRNPALPPEVSSGLDTFVEAARTAFGQNLRSLVLFGSAAEGKLRITSDVNVVVILTQFEQAQADRLRDVVRLARAAIQLKPMFLLESEIVLSARAFAQKFADILRRHYVLYGPDPFTGISVPRELEISHLRQELLNLKLRLRAIYVVASLREEQLGRTLADVTGPIRSCAASLLSLRGQPAPSPKQALAALVAAGGQPSRARMLEQLSHVRDTGGLEAGVAPALTFELLQLLEELYEQAAVLT